MRARGNNKKLQGFSGPLSQKKRRESAHARILEGILNGELRACVDSRRFFVTTDLKKASYKTRNGTKRNGTKRNEMEKIVKSVDSGA